MSSFIWSALGLLLVACLLVYLPWLFRRNHAQKDVLTNAQIIKQRLQELENEQAEGLMSEEDKLAASQELKLALLDEKPDNQGKGEVSWSWLVGGAIGLSITLAVYLYANQIAKVEHWQQVNLRLPELAKKFTGQGQGEIKFEDVQDFALATRTKLKANPDDSIGWFLLGYLYSNMNVAESAMQAYDKSLELDPNNTTTLSNYSQLLLMSTDEKWIRQAHRLTSHWVKVAPSDPQAIGMFAVSSEKVGDMQNAKTSWLRLQTMLPESDPMQVNITEKLASFDQNQASALVSEEKTASPVINIEVSLADDIKSKLPESGFVFVFAQDADSQMKMPAAVVKLPISSFPFQVSLSDQQAMMPTFKLSSLKNARLVARVSEDGNVRQAPGELEGELIVDVLTGSQSQQSIVISKEIF